MTAQRRPYGTLSRETAARAAVEVGFDNLTMTAVAAHLGATTAALYYHVEDRRDLIRAAIDEVATELAPIERIDDVKSFVRAEATAVFGLFTKYPGLDSAIRSLDHPPESFGLRMAGAHRALTDLGVRDGDAFLLMAIVYSHALEASNWIAVAREFHAAAGDGPVEADDNGATEDGFAGLMDSVTKQSAPATYDRLLDLLINGVSSLDPKA